MNIKFKSVIFVFSLIFNALFISVLITASFSKNNNISYYFPDDKLFTAAAVVSLPSDGSAVFESIEISLKPVQKAYLQYAVISSNNQSNLLINAIYDPDIISVIHTGYGIEITALQTGVTLMQTFTNDGLKDIALIIVK